MWNHNNEINLKVKVDGEGILSRIARIKAKTEELECEINGLMKCVEAEQILEHGELSPLHTNAKE